MAEAFAGPSEASCMYDLLFLSSDEDKLWTEENLVKPLDERGYATYLPHRDFTPGMPKLNLLHDALKNSLRTVLVITPEFLEDWKFKQALDATLIDEGKLIPLIYKKCKTLPEALTKVMHLEYSEQRDPSVLLDRIVSSVEQTIRTKSEFSQYDRPRPVGVQDVVVYGPLPGRAAVHRAPSAARDWSVDTFFNDVDGYLQKLDRKEGRPFINIETDICENIIPEHLVKPALLHVSNYDKSRRVLSKLSCYRRSTKIVMVALNALNKLILNDPIEGKTANRINDFEKILRAEIQPASLHAQATKEQRLRLTTYCNLLCCIILHHARGNLKTVFSQEDLFKLETIKKGLENDYEDNNPPRLDCALACTIRALKCMTESPEKFRKTCKTVGDILTEVDCVIRSQSTPNTGYQNLFSKIEKAGAFDIGVAATYLLPKITSASALFCLRVLLDQRMKKCDKTQRQQSSILLRKPKGTIKKHTREQWITLYQTARMLVRVLEDKECPRELRILAATGIHEDVNPQDYMYCAPAELDPVYQDVFRNEGLLCLSSFWSNEHLKKMPGYQTAQPLINKECRELVYSDIPEIANVVSRRLLVKGNCLEVEKLVTEVQPKRIQSLHSNKGLELEQRNPLHSSVTCHKSVVYHGTMSGNHHVVVKVPKIQRLENLQCMEGTDSVDRIRNEIRVLRHLQHDNIMLVCGYVLAIPPVHYITEFMHYGNLQQHLRDNRRVMWPAQHLLGIATDVLKALIYLESRSIVHRNIRARKVLLGQSGKRMAVKLTGFDLAREVEQTSSPYEFNMYQGTHYEEVPLRWLAVESLAYCRYSVKSEIWMYAVLLYEIFTMGCVPWQEFGGRPFDEVLQNIVHRNLRMKRPPCIPNAVFKVILNCMNAEDRSRPSYSMLAEELRCLHDRYLETSDVIYGELLTAPPPIDESINVAYTSPIPTINAPGAAFGAGVSDSEIEDFDAIYQDPDLETYICPRWEEEHIYEDVDKHDMMLLSSVAAADQPQPQDQNLFMEVTRYTERKARTLKDLKREMKNQNSTLQMVDLRQSTKDGSMTVVTEGTASGKLVDFLTKKKDGDPTQYALPIAIALQTMHSRGFVHSDLRLDHVFLDASPHGTHEVQIKLGRLSRVKKLQLGVYDRDLAESMLQDKDGCPTDSIRWSPAEVIQSGTYSFASDVYSLGVVFWQMYIACHVQPPDAHVRLIPYQRLKNEEVLRFLEESPFLRKPPRCPDWMYTVMKKCWAYQLLDRPSVQDVIEVLNHSDHGRRLLGTWSKTCDPPDLSRIYEAPAEGNSMDSVLSDRSQMARGASAYLNVRSQIHPDLMTELSRAIKPQVQTAHASTTPKSSRITLKEEEMYAAYEDIDVSDDDHDYETAPGRSRTLTVVRSYHPQENLRLSFGDTLTHLEELGKGSGWWKGNKRSTEERGIFMSAYVTFVEEEYEITNPDLQLYPDLQAMVIKDYTPDDELTIEAGEIVTIEESLSDREDWISVRSSHGEGWIPSSCLASTTKDTTARLTLPECDIDSDTEDMYEDIQEEGVYTELPGWPSKHHAGAPLQTHSTSHHDFKVVMKMTKTEANNKYRLMVSMADPGQLTIEYRKDGQLKKSADQCLEADIAAHCVTEDMRDYYHPLAYGWTIVSMKKMQGAEDTIFLDWKSTAVDPKFPAAVETGPIIYDIRKANGEEDGRLVLVCMSPSYGKKVVRYEWYKGGELVCEGVDLCMMYAMASGEYRCHIISCQDGQEMAMSETVKVVRTHRVPEDYLILPSALKLMDDPIGEGGCGVVFKARLRRYTQVAAKKLQGCSLDDFGGNNEIEILRTLHHPNIVSFFGVCFLESVLIVTELVNGYDLRQVIIGKEEIPPGCEGYIAYQLCQALDYIHHRMIVHQDVKPSNVLVNAKTYVTKLSDFGLGYVKRSSSRSSQRMKGAARKGTIFYKHNESLQSQHAQPQTASDVYAFACVLYELYSGEEVWNGLDDMQVMYKIAQNEYPNYDHLAGNEKVHSALSLCFTEADRRATMSELLPCVKELVGRNYVVD